MDLTEFEEDRKIDPSALDLAAATQAELYFKWAERAINARGDADLIELQMEVLEAQLQFRIRKDPDQFALEGRVTETSIKAAVACHPEYVTKREQWLEARETSALLDKAVVAMDMRKRMIESLITLHGQQYFAGPATPRDLVGAYQDRQARITANVNKKQKAATRRRGETRPE